VFENIELLEHSGGEWEVDDLDVVNATEIYAEKCTVCGTEIDRKTEELTSMCNGDSFLFTFNEFSERLNKVLKGMKNYNWSVDMAASTCDLFADGEFVGMIMATSEDDPIEIDEMDESIITTVLTIADFDYAVPVFVGLMATCDPTMDVKDENMEDVFMEALIFGESSYNGLTYVYEAMEDEVLIGVMID